MAATVPTSSRAAKAVVSPLKRREQKWGLIFLAPWIIGFILFFAGPMIASLIFSFTNFVLIRPDEMQFVGLANWQRMFTDTAVRKSLGVTLRFMLVSVPISMIVPLCLAVLLNYKHLAFKPLFRTMFYMPFMVPGVAGALIWSGVLNPQSGWVNMLLSKIGITGPDWLNNPTWVIPALTMMGLWGIGNTMVIMLAGLQGVPSELYDASRVDGAGPIRTFFNITLPMISPVIFYNLVLAVIGSFQYFLNAYVLYNSQAGPDDAALFYMLNLYREAFVYYNMGYASTLAWGMFLVALVITVVLFSTSNRWVYYSSGDA